MYTLKDPDSLSMAHQQLHFLDPWSGAFILHTRCRAGNPRNPCQVLVSNSPSSRSLEG